MPIYSRYPVVSGGGGGGGAATWKGTVASAAFLPLVGNTDGDVRVTLDTDYIYVWDATSSSWKLQQNFFVEKFTLNGTDITNGFVTLSRTPVLSSAVCLDIIGGIQQDNGTDFTVTGTQLSWTGLGLDGVLASGDKLIIYYY